MPVRILLVDPLEAHRDALELALDAAEGSLRSAPDARAALAVVDGEGADVAICDPAVAGLDDFELVPQLLRRDPSLQVLLALPREASGRYDLAARLGAADLVDVPFDPAQLRHAIAGARARIEQSRRRGLLERDVQQAVGEKPIVGASPSMIVLLEALERAAGFKTPVSIEGETGTHREVLARAIHAQSLRRTGPFVAVRCAGSGDPDTESRLFKEIVSPGRRRLPDVRAADGGTLFLDDLPRLSQPAQTRLLHLLEREEVVDDESGKARPVDVRVIVASTEPLEAEQRAERILPELAARLSNVVLRVPALRDRGPDIPLLVDHAIARMRSELGIDLEGVSDAAMDRLCHYEWPGNLRELENVIERAALLARGDRITLHELPASIATSVPGGAEGRSGDFSLRRARRSFEAEMIRRALRKTDGNRTRAARLLEISHRALLYKIKEYGLRD